MRNQRLRALVGFVWGSLLFLAVARSVKLGLGAMSGSVVVSQIVFKTALIVVALIAWKLMGRPFHELGWRRADWWNRSYRKSFVIAMIAMMVASAVMIFAGLRHPLAAQMNFLQVVLVIWGLSSFSEEVYVRGLVQSWIADRDDESGKHSFLEPPVVASAFLFASMHVTLMWSPIGVKGGLVIVLATLFVGFGCALLRARTKSLWPAIACHVLGNMAGVPGGILGIVLYRLIYGRLPEFLTSG